MMHDHDIHHPPVMDGGVITQKDINAIQMLVLDRGTDENLENRHAYISKPYIVDINDPLEKMLLKMEHEHIGAAIISKHEKLVGVFTYIDACRCFGEYIKLNSPVKQVTISLKKH